MNYDDARTIELNLEDLKLLYGFCHFSEINGDERATKWKREFENLIKSYAK